MNVNNDLYNVIMNITVIMNVTCYYEYTYNMYGKYM